MPVQTGQHGKFVDVAGFTNQVYALDILPVNVGTELTHTILGIPIRFFKLVLPELNIQCPINATIGFTLRVKL